MTRASTSDSRTLIGRAQIGRAQIGRSRVERSIFDTFMARVAQCIGDPRIGRPGGDDDLGPGAATGLGVARWTGAHAARGDAEATAIDA